MKNRFAHLGVIAIFTAAGYGFTTTPALLTFGQDAVAATLQLAAEEPPALPGEQATAEKPAKKKTAKKKPRKSSDKDSDGIPGTRDGMMTAEPVVYRSADTIFPKDRQETQAVLVAKNSAVISSTLDARLVNFPFKSGDVFEKDDILAEYDCRVEAARLREAEARARLTEKQLKAYTDLKSLDAVADIELVSVQESHKQNAAAAEQVRGRLSLCKIKAPFSGRVTNKMASPHEFVQTGRVLMEIASREKLEVEFLVPSIWLRWLNIGTPLDVYVQESGRTYGATVTRIHGEVDPVSQSVQVTAEIDSYQEELLPGMSGKAVFKPEDIRQKTNFGFIGLMLTDPDAADGGASP